MSDSLKDSMMLYGVTLARRYTKKQKQMFLDQIKDTLHQKNIPYKIQEKRSSILTIENVIIGNPEKADYVIAAAYDTPSAALISSYRWYPFQMSKNRQMNKKNQIVEGILVTAFLLLAGILAFQVHQAPSLWIKVILIIAAVIAAVTGFHLSKGNSIPCSFNANSASVALLMDLVSEYGNDSRFCFVLMDESVMSMEGVKYLKEEIPDNTPVLFLSSLAEGKEKLIVSGSQKWDKMTDNQYLDIQAHHLNEKQKNESVLGLYPNGAVLIFGDRENNDFVSPNVRTSKDNSVDMKALENCKKMLEDWFEKRKER